MKDLLSNLKEKNQDWEFYPTTDEIINKINSLKLGGSILDIGCGNGQTLQKLDSFDQKFGIEKSEILIKNCDPSIIIIGTDFYQQTLIDKEVGNIFCNPPYSQFKEWTKKILEESTSRNVIMVIPSRWSSDEHIQDIIKKRGWDSRIIGNYDFLDAERKARAYVDLVIFSKPLYYGAKQKDAFSLFFEKTFNIKDEKKEIREEIEGKIKKGLGDVVQGDSLVKTLCNLYDVELNSIFENYRNISKLDAGLLNELGVSIQNLKEALQKRIENLKIIYWQELFTKFRPINERLSIKYRDEFRKKLSNKVDFNESNIYAVVIWAIKNANKYIDEQLIDLFYQFTDEKNIINYKSNKKTWVNDDFRYNNKRKIDMVILDNRIIFESWGENHLQDGEFRYSYSMSGNETQNILSDVCTVARTLGYVVDLPHKSWEYGKAREIHCSDSQEEKIKLFATIKIFKKGTIHIKFNQEFIKHFNVKVSNLLGWIKDKSEAYEMGATEEEYLKYSQTRIKIDERFLLN